MSTWLCGVLAAACGNFSAACGVFIVVRRFSSCSSRASLLQAMRVFRFSTRDQTHVPCVLKRFLTTGPPGKSPGNHFQTPRFQPRGTKPGLFTSSTLGRNSQTLARAIVHIRRAQDCRARCCISPWRLNEHHSVWDI